MGVRVSQPNKLKRLTTGPILKQGSRPPLIRPTIILIRFRTLILTNLEQLPIMMRWKVIVDH